MEVDSERVRGGGDICMPTLAIFLSAALSRTECRKREEAEEGEEEGEVAADCREADGRMSGDVMRVGGDMSECDGEKAPCSMGRPVERSEMAVGERMVGEDDWEWKAEGILRGGNIPTIVALDADIIDISTTGRRTESSNEVEWSHMKQCWTIGRLV